MKLEALQGFLRVNPQNTVNDVSLQGKAKRQRRKKKRQSALSKARSKARQKVSGVRQRGQAVKKRIGQSAPAMRLKKSSLQVPARVAAVRQKRQMNGGSIKNAIGGMEMSVNDMLMQPGTGRGILDGNMYGSLNGPGKAARQAARKARRAQRAAKKQARQAKRQDRKKKTADRRASRGTRRDERLAAKQQRQATREARKQNRLERRARRKEMSGAERRAERRDERRTRREERQQGRQDKRAERQDARAARRLERQESRQEAKRLRQEQRQQKRNERRGDGGVLRDVFGNITETAGEIFGGGDDGGGGFFSEGGAGAGFAESFEDATGFDFPLGQDDPESELRSGDGEPIEDESSLPIVPIAIGAAVVGYLALSGKGKKGKRKKRK